MIKVQACAKINLMLDITGRRSNGYHDLFMVMQSVDLCDFVTVEKRKRIYISCSDNTIPTDKRNIAHKAANAFFKHSGICGGAKIHIEKHIPSAAGLAGGSADGAAVITALNELYNTGYKLDELCRIGVQAGADVPFCICGKTRVCTGIGEKMELIRPIENCFILLVKPNCSVSTAEAYAEYDKYGRRRKPDQKGIVKAIKLKNLNETARLMENVFEQFIEVPARPHIKAIMRANGAVGSCMSGSGPTVFGIFRTENDCARAYEQLKTEYEETFMCRPTYFGCKIV